MWSVIAVGAYDSRRNFRLLPENCIEPVIKVGVMHR